MPESTSSAGDRAPTGRSGPGGEPFPWRVVAVVSLGGVIGSLTRWALTVLFPHERAGMPWAVLAINVTGCLLLGLLVGLVARRWPHTRLVRPFLGTGVLGGFTTFSTYAADARAMIAAGRVLPAVAYLAGSVLAGVLAAALGALLAGRVPRAGARSTGDPAGRARPAAPSEPLARVEASSSASEGP